MATVNSIISEVAERVGDVELERITKEQVIVLINASARDLIGAGVVIPIDSEALETVAATYEYAVPANFAYINEIWEESGATPNLYPRRILHSQWYIRLVGSTPTLIFEADLFTLTALRNLKLVGHRRPTDTYTISGATDIDIGMEGFIRERTTSYSARQLAEFAEGDAKSALEGIATATWEESRKLLGAVLAQPLFRPALHARVVPGR